MPESIDDNQEASTPIVAHRDIMFLPVEIFLTEANLLMAVVGNHLSDFLERGFDRTVTDQFNSRLAAARQAESTLNHHDTQRDQNQKVRAEKFKEVFAFRDSLIKNLKSTWYDNPEKLIYLKTLGTGRRLDDLVQDLDNLITLSNGAIHDLMARDFETYDLLLAEVFEKQIETARASAEDERRDSSELKQLRDRAYTHLYSLVLGGRRFARHLYQAQPDKLNLFTSKYTKK